MNYLIFKIRDYILGIKSSSVQKIVQRMLKLEENAYSWISGYISVNGNKVHIVDVLYQLGLSMCTYPNGRLHSFILFNYDNSQYGIMADSIMGETKANSLSNNSIKTIYGTNNPKIISGSLAFNGENVPVLNEEFLVPSIDLIRRDIYKIPTQFFPSYQNYQDKILENNKSILSYGN